MFFDSYQYFYELRSPNNVFLDRLYWIFYYTTFHKILQTLRKFVFLYYGLRNLFRHCGVQITCFEIVYIECFPTQLFTKLYKDYEILFFRSRQSWKSVQALESSNNVFWYCLLRKINYTSFHQIVQTYGSFFRCRQFWQSI